MNETIKKLLQNYVKQYIVHNKIEAKEPEKLNERYKLRGKDYYAKIEETVNRDVQQASFGLPTKRLTALQKTTFEVSLTHGLTMFAKYLVTGEETINDIK